MNTPPPDPVRRKRNRRILIALWLIVLALALLVPLALKLPDDAHKAAGPVRIQKVLDAQRDAWNQGDLEGFMDGYWNSDELEFHSAKAKATKWVTWTSRIFKSR
jgi:hypothetical protein